MNPWAKAIGNPGRTLTWELQFRSGLLVGKERPENLVIRTERAPAGRWWTGEEHVANEARDPLVLLRLVQQAAQHLHCGNVVAQLVGQDEQRNGRARIGKGGQ
ncbi:hypothetical protein KH5H1_59150 [Corallococcus caeni]|nr:hypothetical protein KH5H1_59150 [Corallococcus sp. KH5-1]